MKKVFSAIAVSMIVATPVLAKTARYYNMAPSAQRQDYVGSEYVGTDPDPAVRSELRRDAGHENE